MPEFKPYNKPLPLPDHYAVSQPFWEGLQRNELLIPRCKQCEKLHFYPREHCPYCFSQDLTWFKCSGKAVLYAYTLVYQPAHPGFQDETPYIHAVVQLAEGPHMVTNVIGIPADPEHVKIGTELQAVFEHVHPLWSLVKFKPI